MYTFNPCKINFARLPIVSGSFVCIIVTPLNTFDSLLIPCEYLKVLYIIIITINNFYGGSATKRIIIKEPPLCGPLKSCGRFAREMETGGGLFSLV